VQVRARLGRRWRGQGGLRHRLRGLPGKVLDPLVERPEIIGADLAEVADAILVIAHGDERP
jgi:hypothetical protein